MISGDELKYRNGLAGFLGLGIGSPDPNCLKSQSGAFALTVPTAGANGGGAAAEDFVKNHYHQVSDEVSLIDFEQLGRFADVNFEIIRNVANMAEKPVRNAGDFFAETFGGEMEQ
jgi:hypothetical protein